MNYQLHGQGLTRRASEYPVVPPGQHFMARKTMRVPSIPIAYGLSTDQKAYANFNSGVHVRATPSRGKGKTSGYYRRRRRSSRRRRTSGPPRRGPPRYRRHRTGGLSKTDKILNGIGIGLLGGLPLLTKRGRQAVGLKK